MISREDEKILQNGPLPCPWKNYANELICIPGCGNFEAIRDQLIEAQKRMQKLGKSISVSEMIQGIRDGEFGIIQPQILSRTICKEQPRIPITATGVY